MIAEFLQDRAALYASGALDATEREEFELILAVDPELQELTRELMETGALLSAALGSGSIEPAKAVRERILAAIQSTEQTIGQEGLVVCGPDGLVHWVNPAFMALCGYELEEVRGRKLGPLLQGPDTDQSAVERIRSALRDFRPSRETILNYHKDGRPYWADISITPIFNDADELSCFIAREAEVPHGPEHGQASRP